MEIRQLKYFIFLAEKLNFTLAAKGLYVTQPCLSHQIAELEKFLGVKLFLRDKHSVLLTAAGEAILKEAKTIVAKAESMIQIARQAETGTIGNLNLGFLGSVERQFLPQLISRFRQGYPMIELTLKQHIHLNYLDQTLYNGETDIAITLKSKQDILPLLNYRRIYETRDALVLAANHPLAEKVEGQFSLLNREMLFYVDRNGSSRGLDTILRLCTERGVSPKVQLVPDMQTVLTLIESGGGFSILPRAVLENYSSPLLRYIDIEGIDAIVEIVAAWRSDNHNPSLSLFIDELELQVAQADSKAYKGPVFMSPCPK
ncbi:MAG: transcriptional regulator AlsR family [Firmicutes bacterium]|nr:transcriptional regulator AlsR family [Bacillota bacterium]